MFATKESIDAPFNNKKQLTNHIGPLQLERMYFVCCQEAYHLHKNWT